MIDFACPFLPRSIRSVRLVQRASVLSLLLGTGSFVGCGGNAMTGNGSAGNTSQAGRSNAGGDSNGGSATGNGGDGGDTAGGAGGSGAATPAEERAAAACGAAIEATNDYREGFCTIAAALDAQDAVMGAADAGAQVSPEATCEACLTGNDSSQNAALESCTEAAVGCDDLTVDEVENCLTAAGDELDANLPTCDEAADPATAGAVVGLLVILSIHEECSAFLGCVEILQSLTGQ